MATVPVNPRPKILSRQMLLALSKHRDYGIYVVNRRRLVLPHRAAIIRADCLELVQGKAGDAR